jgi:hypothetical protein
MRNSKESAIMQEQCQSKIGKESKFQRARLRRSAREKTLVKTIFDVAEERLNNMFLDFAKRQVENIMHEFGTSTVLSIIACIIDKRHYDQSEQLHMIAEAVDEYRGIRIPRD